MSLLLLNGNRLYWAFSNGIAKVNNKYDSSQQKTNFLVLLLIHIGHAMFQYNTIIDWLNHPQKLNLNLASKVRMTIESSHIGCRHCHPANRFQRFTSTYLFIAFQMSHQKIPASLSIDNTTMSLVSMLHEANFTTFGLIILRYSSVPKKKQTISYLVIVNIWCGCCWSTAIV